MTVHHFSLRESPRTLESARPFAHGFPRPEGAQKALPGDLNEHAHRRRHSVGFLVVLACAGRLIHLDADPSFPTWIGYVVDEGRWNETARNLALFEDPDVNWMSRLHLFMSPGYQAVNYVVFLALGVDFWSARLFAAITGILLVLTVSLQLRRHVTPLALAFGVVILGLETNCFGQSRMALPEMPALLATLLAFLRLFWGEARPGAPCLPAFLPPVQSR